MEFAGEMFSRLPIVGSATLAMAPSRTESDTPNVTASMAHNRLGMGIPFHSVLPEMTGAPPVVLPFA